MTKAEPVGVLVMSYGTPARREDIETYYTHVRRGHPPTPQLLDDLVRRYEAIGGVSPLTERTAAQGQGIQRALDSVLEGRFRVYLGAKHAAPFIEDAVEAMVNDGVTRAVGLVLAPHYSSMSIGEYAERAEKASSGRLDMTFVESWHLEPGFITLLAERLVDAHRQLGVVPEKSMTLVTAHSLPARILESGDPYARQLEDTGIAITAMAQIINWQVAWQSAGRTPEPWIGPDIIEVIRGLPDQGIDGVVVCPAGFVSDHLEVLYDVDIEARQAADDVGIRLVRTKSLNDDPQLMSALATVVAAHATKLE